MPCLVNFAVERFYYQSYLIQDQLLYLGQADLASYTSVFLSLPAMDCFYFLSYIFFYDFRDKSSLAKVITFIGGNLGNESPFQWY